VTTEVGLIIEFTNGDMNIMLEENSLANQLSKRGEFTDRTLLKKLSHGKIKEDGIRKLMMIELITIEKPLKMQNGITFGDL